MYPSFHPFLIDFFLVGPFFALHLKNKKTRILGTKKGLSFFFSSSGGSFGWRCLDVQKIALLSFAIGFDPPFDGQMFV